MISKNIFKKISIFLGLLAIFFVLLFLSKPAQAPVIPNKNKFEIQNSKPEIEYTTLFFAGDIMLSRNVENKMSKANPPATQDSLLALRAGDYTLPFKNVSSEISASDIAIGNLESPFNDKGKYFVENSLVFNADPKSIEGLKYAGFDILSLANNHTLDQGIKGLDFTIQYLIDNGIIPTGAINSKNEVKLPTIEKNGLIFGFLSYSYAGLNDGGPPAGEAGKTVSKYVNNFNDLDKLKQDILSMKGHTADIVIISMHAGIEYTRMPSPAQIAFAHAAIDAGADLVIGHHPHWIQPVERYNDKWIFYSLGNFVFDQMWSQDTREGLTVFITYENEHIPDPLNQSAGENRITIKKIELKPIIIEDYCCPRWADSAESLKILGKIGLTSPLLLDKNE